MKILPLLNQVNDKQRDAVAASRVNLLVLAGAGSGKTRVLVHRIAWLQVVERCPPHSIMAVTFTNKAAEEMQNRITKLVDHNIDQNDMLVGTFHGLAHRFLRIHYSDANLPKNFQIFDSEDQTRLIKRLVNTLGFNNASLTLKKIMWYINAKKDEGIRPNNMQNFSTSYEYMLQKIYKTYQEICDRSGLVDFSELLLRTREVCLNKPHILQLYQKRFTNILVDEFQDTNSIQYDLIRLLAKETGKVMIVGDDDQSIYGWRGAQVENIQRFINDFPSVKTIRLEQNYRSTNNILSAANALIENNNLRLGKKLWTNSTSGEPISLYSALNELDEAHFVTQCIQTWQNRGGLLNQCAILYRNNVQSRVLEEMLLQMRIPYQIYGGIRFFERQEIKDVLSYLRLIVNRNDDTAFERIINTPTRGIGMTTLTMIRQLSRDSQLTLWQASCTLLKQKIITERAANSLQSFLELIETLSKATDNMPLHVQADIVIKNSGLWMMYKKDKSEKGQIRTENLEEFKAATHQFYKKKVNKDVTLLQEFLSHAILEDTLEKKSYISNHHGNVVQLMTLHAAKGLEFQQVFIVGMEEGVFPSQSFANEKIHLEEERRLAYVGITRAIKKLTLTYAKTRRLYGKNMSNLPSRFINEFPIHCIKKIQFTKNISSINH